MSKDVFSLSAYEYDLPKELIAHHPTSSREDSRLMIVDRTHGTISDRYFRDIYDLLQPQDTLVLNNTKVIPARLYGKKETGATIEILLIRSFNNGTWEALLKPAKKVPLGATLKIAEDFSCEILEEFPCGSRRLIFRYADTIEKALNKYGQMPLPPYIERQEQMAIDSERYQTVYAKNVGAVAAPTAGLHFSEDLLKKLSEKGILQTHITLHIGLGTFRPVKTEDIRNHQMHSEYCIISPEAAENLNNRQNGKLHICVGTTSCRTLESSVTSQGIIVPGQYDTNIFIYPGYQFKYVQSLLTNFHLPCSTLLMLVSAFAGYELIQEAYAKAIEKKFRFFSYGDAMLII